MKAWHFRRGRDTTLEPIEEIAAVNPVGWRRPKPL